jgi:hypothetical protein
VGDAPEAARCSIALQLRGACYAAYTGPVPAPWLTTVLLLGDDEVAMNAVIALPVAPGCNTGLLTFAGMQERLRLDVLRLMWDVDVLRPSAWDEVDRCAWVATSRPGGALNCFWSISCGWAGLHLWAALQLPPLSTPA